MLNPFLKTTRLCMLVAASMGMNLLCEQASFAADPTPPAETNWTGSFTAGLTLTEGNSDTLMITAIALAEKKWGSHELSLGADASYGEQEDVKNNETLHGFGQYNRLFTERWYGYARLDALHDAIADVDYRVTLGVGPGYYFIKNDRTFLRAELGPGVVFEKQGGEEQVYMTIRVAERFEHKLTKNAKLWQSLELLPQVGDWCNFVVNAEIGIEVAINSKWSLKTYLQDIYDNEPAPGREENDLKLVSGVSYKF